MEDRNDSVDAGLDAVEAYLKGVPNLNAIVAKALRQAIDDVLDGARTGRWDIDELTKTEKAYIGTRAEIVLKYELKLEDGRKLDASVADHEVDIKFSITPFKQMIALHDLGEICLLAWADDKKSKFSLGVVRASAAILGRPNQDKKKTISAHGRASIRWLIPERDGWLPINFMRSLPADTRAEIMASRSGQVRINELFRHVQGLIVPRDGVMTVAHQKDGMKRVRDARKYLKREGLRILGSSAEDKMLARQLGVPEPKKGEFVCVKMANG